VLGTSFSFSYIQTNFKKDRRSKEKERERERERVVVLFPQVVGELLVIGIFCCESFVFCFPLFAEMGACTVLFMYGFLLNVVGTYVHVKL
jgi:hypothetical protein